MFWSPESPAQSRANNARLEDAFTSGYGLGDGAGAGVFGSGFRIQGLGVRVHRGWGLGATV